MPLSVGGVGAGLRKLGAQPQEEEEGILSGAIMPFLSRLGDILGGPSQALANVSLAGLRNDPDRLVSAGKNLGTTLIGLTTFGLGPSLNDQNDRASFDDVLGELGMQEGGARTALGFGLDVGLDPLTYVSLGSTAAAKVGTTAGLRVASKASSRRMLRKMGLAANDETVSALQRISQLGLTQDGIAEVTKRADRIMSTAAPGKKSLLERLRTSPGEMVAEAGAPTGPIERLAHRLGLASPSGIGAGRAEDVARGIATRRATRDLMQEAIEKGATGASDLPPELAGLFDQAGLKLGIPGLRHRGFETGTLAFAGKGAGDIIPGVVLGKKAVQGLRRIDPAVDEWIDRIHEFVGSRFFPSLVLSGPKLAFLREAGDRLQNQSRKAGILVDELLVDPVKKARLGKDDRKLLAQILRSTTWEEGAEGIVKERGLEAFLTANPTGALAERAQELAPIVDAIEGLLHPTKGIPMLENRMAQQAMQLGIPGASALRFKALEYYVPQMYTRESLRAYLREKGSTLEDLFGVHRSTLSSSKHRKHRVFPTLDALQGAVDADKNSPLRHLVPEDDIRVLLHSRLNAHVKAMEWTRTLRRFESEFGAMTPGAQRALSRMFRSQWEQSILDSVKGSLPELRKLGARAQIEDQELEQLVQRAEGEATESLDRALTSIQGPEAEAARRLMRMGQLRQQAATTLREFNGADIQPLKAELDLLSQPGGPMALGNSVPSAQYPRIARLVDAGPELTPADLERALAQVRAANQVKPILAGYLRESQGLREQLLKTGLKEGPRPDVQDIAIPEVQRLGEMAEDATRRLADSFSKGLIDADDAGQRMQEMLEIWRTRDMHAMANAIGDPAFKINNRFFDTNALAKALEQEFKAQESIRNLAGRALDYVTKPVKLSLTALFPAFHVRNAVSGLFQTAIEPVAGIRALKNLLPAGRADQVLSALPSTTVSTPFGNLTGPEVLALAERHGVVRRDVVSQEMVDFFRTAMIVPNKAKTGLELKPQKPFVDAFKKALSPRGDEPGIFRKLASPFLTYKNVMADWLGPALENRQRMASFIAQLETGADPATAAANVGRFFVDYRYRSQAERFVRNIIPFYKFDAEMIPALLAEMARRPVVGSPLKLAHLLSEDAKREGIMLPGFLEEQLSIPLGTVDNEGNPQILGSFGTPYDAIQKLGVGGVRPIDSVRRTFERTALGGLNPLIKAFGEEVTQRSFFFGEPKRFWDQLPKSAANLPEGVKSVLGIQTLPDGRVVGDPEYLDIGRNAPLIGRGTTTLLGLLDERKTLGQKLIRYGGGINVYSPDQEREAIRELRDTLGKKARMGEVLEFPVFAVPERLKGTPQGDQYERMLRRLRDLKKSARGDRKKLLGARVVSTAKSLKSPRRRLTPKELREISLEHHKARLKKLRERTTL